MIIKTKQLHSYKCLNFLVMMYFLVIIFSEIFGKKIISFPFILHSIPISLFPIGVFFVLSDIITEVYGYVESQKIFISMIIVFGIYNVSVQMISDVQSPNFFVFWSHLQDVNAYNYIFSNAIRFYLAVLVAFFVAIYINMYLISKWKILLKGHYFWLRSIGASGLTTLLFSVITVTIVDLPGAIDSNNFNIFFKIMLVSFLIKIFVLCVCAYPASIICNILKKVEGVDIYDININYNPLAKRD